MKGLERTLAEARSAARTEPKRWKACVYVATEEPITESESTKVWLFALVKTAENRLRFASRVMERFGWKRTFGNLGAGLIQFEKDGEMMWIALDKRR